MVSTDGITRADASEVMEPRKVLIGPMNSKQRRESGRYLQICSHRFRTVRVQYIHQVARARAQYPIQLSGVWMRLKNKGG